MSGRRTALAIWGTMVVGATAFIGMAYVFALGKVGLDPAILETLGGMALALAVLALVLPRRFPAGGDPGKRAGTRVLVGGAIAEGGALIGAVGLLVSGDLRVLAALAVPYLVLLAQFPSEARWSALGED